MSLMEKVVNRAGSADRANEKPNNAFFADLIATITDRGRDLFGLRPPRPTQAPGRADALVELCETLLGGKGEASGTAMAQEVIEAYETLRPQEQLTFFEALAEKLGPDEALLDAAVEEWRETGSGVGGAGKQFSSKAKGPKGFPPFKPAPEG